MTRETNTVFHVPFTESIVVPYPGEVYILNKILDAVIDVNGERSVDDAQKLFLVRAIHDTQYQYCTKYRYSCLDRYGYDILCSTGVHYNEQLKMK